MSLSHIIFQLVSIVSFPQLIMHSSDIDELATLVYLNSTKLSHEFMFSPLSLSHVN